MSRYLNIDFDRLKSICIFLLFLLITTYLTITTYYNLFNNDKFIF